MTIEDIAFWLFVAFGVLAATAATLALIFIIKWLWFQITND